MSKELTRHGNRFLMSPRSIFPSFFTEEMDRMSRLFHDFLGQEKGTTASMWGPPLDMLETENNIIVKAELPGIDPKALDISISGDMLTLKGEKKADKEEKSEYYYCCERVSGEFSRSITLPSSVDKDKIDASYNNGILKIEMQKIPEAKSKKIAVKS